MSVRMDAFEPAPPLVHQDRVLLAGGPVAPWADHLVAHHWALAGTGDEIDVVVCFDAASLEIGKAHPDAGIIHMPTTGATWAGEGADLVLFDPTPREFMAACRRAQRLAHARRMTREYASDILECTQDAFFVLDWDRCVVYQNPRALALVARLEGGTGDILGDPLAGHLPRALLDVIEPNVIATLRDAAPRSCDVHVLPLRAWVEANVYFIPGGATVFLRDITARKSANAVSDAAAHASSQARALALLRELAGQGNIRIEATAERGELLITFELDGKGGAEGASQTVRIPIPEDAG